MIAISSLIAVLSYAVALCGIVPLFPWLSMTPRLLLVAGMAAGIWQSLRGSWPLKNWLLNVSIIPVFLFYALHLSRSNAVQPVVNVLAVMLAVRLMGEKKRSSLYADPGSLALLPGGIFPVRSESNISAVFGASADSGGGVAGAADLLRSGQPHCCCRAVNLRRVVAAGFLMPVISAPLLIFFFPLLPRTQIPLWNVSAAPAPRITGLSDKVEPGLSANVTESPVPAFRAELPLQPSGRLYWRGTVFNRFEGNRWVRDGMVPPERLAYGSTRITQVIYLEPGFSRFLLALDAPASTSAFRARFNQDATVEKFFSGNKRITYKVDSSVGGFLPVTGGIERDFYLKLPSTIPVRISRLAADIRGRGNSNVHRLELLEQFFRNGGYRYAMQGLPTGGDALERFLFEGKQGNCEFFASVFAILARSAGIPARLVGGYLGGEYNDAGGYYLVTESMAHVWVEVYIDGKGWLRIDPSGFASNAGSRGMGRFQTARHCAASAHDT